MRVIAHSPSPEEWSRDSIRQLRHIDFASLSTDERGSDASTFEPGLTEEIAEVSRQIDGMAPNMKAITQFDEVSDRLHTLEGEFDTSRSHHQSVWQKFEAVKAKRTALFNAAFKAISEYIDEVYKDLTQVEGVPLGGTAYLSLQVSECGRGEGRGRRTSSP